MNILALVSYESDENWISYDKNVFDLFLTLTYERIGIKKNILACFIRITRKLNVL